MTFNGAPTSGGEELSFESPDQEAARLAKIAQAPNVMEALREAQAEGNTEKIREAEQAADEKYIVTPETAETSVELHDAHVEAFEEDKSEKFFAALDAVEKKSAAEYNNPEVVRARIERMYEALPKISDSQVSALIRDTTLKVDMLADKNPTYLAGDTLEKLARDLSKDSPDTFEATLASETAKYLDGVKSKFKQAGYNPRVVDILTSGKDKESKVKDLEQISFTV